MALNDILKRILTARVYDLAVQTPLHAMPVLSSATGAQVWLKREDLQPIFSFKLRGAVNRMARLDAAERKAGVIAASAGNHAQGVAMAARHFGIPAVIVMPEATPSIKVDAVRALGADVVLHGEAYDDASTYARAQAEKTGMTYVHPFDDPDVIAGQGTIGMEILQQAVQKPAAVFVPVGGGGLIAGVGAYIKAVMPDVKVIGVEPEGAAAFAKSMAAGHRVALNRVDRFADGVAVREIGEQTFALARACVDDVITVSVDEICTAVRDVFIDVRAIVEPSGALSVAGLKKYAQENDVADAHLVAIASGANVNFDRFGSIVERAELGSGGEVLLAVTIPERPGSFLEFCRLIGNRNISEFNYRYASESAAQVLAGIRIQGGQAERAALIAAITAAGLPVYDMTDNEMAKRHVRHMVGGRVHTPEKERLYRFEFPERAGALGTFLTALAGRWSISLFHYRNHGSAYGQVLVGMLVPAGEDAAFQAFLNETGFEYHEETDNPAYAYFLLPEAQTAPADIRAAQG